MRPSLPLHMSEVPNYEVRGDCILVVWRDLEIYIPVPICQAAVGRCCKALDEWREREGLVVPIRERVAAE